MTILKGLFLTRAERNVPSVTQIRLPILASPNDLIAFIQAIDFTDLNYVRLIFNRALSAPTGAGVTVVYGL
jgi:hypothetical protein